MAVFHGNNGVVEIGANALASVQSFDYNEVTETVDGSGMGESKSYLSGQADGSGSVTCNFDPDDTGQADIVNGDSITLTLYGEGKGSGKYQQTGTVVIDNVSYSVSKSGAGTLSFNFKGVLTKSDQV